MPNLTQRTKAEKQKSRKNGDKDGKALQKLMNNVVLVQCSTNNVVKQ